MANRRIKQSELVWVPLKEAARRLAVNEKVLRTRDARGYCERFPMLKPYQPDPNGGKVYIAEHEIAVFLKWRGVELEVRDTPVAAPANPFAELRHEFRQYPKLLRALDLV